MNIISLGIPELDRSLGGGIPYPSLVTIEGEHGSGKTVLAQQIVHSMLDNALKVYVITSEATVKEYLQMMKSVKLDVYDYYTSGQLSIYPLHVQGGKWSKFLSSFFLKVASSFLELKKERYDTAIIDSLSPFAIDAAPHTFLTFITRVKNIVSRGKSIIITFHPAFLAEESITALRAASDVYLVMKNSSVSGMDVKLLRIVKLWGASGERKSVITLEVHPSLGLRVMPLGGVKV